jgi:predicted lactoylglutathione lyase
MGMKPKSISGITYYVSDLQKTAAFYEKLGFRFGSQNTDQRLTAYINWFWIDFLPQEAGQDAPNTDIMIYISVEDTDEFYQAVIAAGLEPTSQPNDTDFSRREFRLQDPDGYQLVFFKKK